MFENVTTLSFDVVGTLIDFESGILDWWKPILRRHGIVISDNELLSRLGEAEAKLQCSHPEMPYTDMLPLMYRDLSHQLGIENTDSESKAFPESISDWPAFDDSVDILKQLGERFRLVAFTNADAWACNEMSRTLGDPFHTVVTCDEVNENKPSLRFFRYGLDKVGILPEKLLHVAQSQYHDIAPAKQLGLSTAWIERRHAKEGSGATPPTLNVMQPDLHLTSLEQLGEVLGCSSAV